MIKVFAEFAGPHGLFEIDVCRMIRRTSNGNGFSRANADDLALLQHRAAACLCRLSESSPISSRNSVPFLAISNQPAVDACAPVKARR